MLNLEIYYRYLPLFARSVFHEGADTYSHLMAFSGAGSIVGALIVAWLGKFPRMGLTALVMQIVYGLLILVCLYYLVPLYVMISTSLKERTAVFTPTPEWLPWPPRLQNYVDVFGMAPFGLFLVNTLLVVTGILAVQLVTITLAAYVFARRRFRGDTVLFFLFLLQMMIPIHATFVSSGNSIRQTWQIPYSIDRALPHHVQWRPLPSAPMPVAWAVGAWY